MKPLIADGGFYLPGSAFFFFLLEVKVRVQVEYFNSYNMPGGCVACGNPLTPHIYAVGTSNWSGKQSVSLKFPICEDCHKASKVGISANRLGCLGALMLAAIGISLGVGLNSLINGAGLEFAGGLVGFIAGFILARYLGISRNPPEVKERMTRLANAVRMLGFSLPSLFGKGWIKLEFADTNYGNQFMLLNGGKV